MKSHKINVCSGLHSMKYHEFLFQDISQPELGADTSRHGQLSREMSGDVGSWATAAACHSYSHRPHGHTGPYGPYYAMLMKSYEIMQLQIKQRYIQRSNNTKLKTYKYLWYLRKFRSSVCHDVHVLFCLFSVLFSMPIIMRFVFDMAQAAANSAPGLRSGETLTKLARLSTSIDECDDECNDECTMMRWTWHRVDRAAPRKRQHQFVAAAP